MPFSSPIIIRSLKFRIWLITSATALSLLEVPVERAIMVGDRIRTDIAMGIAAGTSTALVLTGDTALADLDQFAAPDLPDFVLECISALAEPLQRALV